MYWINDEGSRRQYSDLSDALACCITLATIEGKSGRRADYAVFYQESPDVNSRKVYDIIAYPGTYSLQLPSLTIVNMNH